jgi:hypothetical protein
MDMLDAVMKWIVAPVAAFVWILHQRQAEHHTELAVIKSQIAIDKTNHDRELKEMRETVKAIFAKLDSIEETLRHR